MFLRHLFLLILCLQTFSLTKCLQCAVDCPWYNFPLNVSLPFGICRHADRANGQCTASIEVDFKDRFTRGQFYMLEHFVTALLTIETTFQLETDSIESMIRYSCSMTDYCEYQFLDELTTNKLAQLNSTHIYQKFHDLLIQSPTNQTEISCFDQTCPSNSFCQVTLNHMISPIFNNSQIYRNFTCKTLLSNDTFLTIYDTYEVPHIRLSTMVIRCNTDQCDSNKTVYDIYNLLRSDFVIPLNYSILDIDDDVVSASTKLNPTIFYSICFMILFQWKYPFKY